MTRLADAGPMYSLLVLVCICIAILYKPLIGRTILTHITGALSSAFPGAIPGERNCKVRMRCSKTLWYVLIT